MIKESRVSEIQFQTRKLSAAANELSWAVARANFSFDSLSYAAARLTAIKEAVAVLEGLFKPPCTNTCECPDCEVERFRRASDDDDYDDYDDDD
jgi:hypothetical protein